MRLILLGSPGAGKGTQGKLICDQYQIAHISTGDILRRAVSAGSTLGSLVKKTMEKGELVSDQLMIELVKERIQAKDCKNGFLLDGFPRTIPQAESLDMNKIYLDYVIEIKVPDTELIQRLSGRRLHPTSGRLYHILYQPPKVAGKDDITGERLIQRPDDQEETVRHRLKVYHEQTKPLIQYYKKQVNEGTAPQYIEIEGSGTTEEVRDRIFAALNHYEVLVRGAL